MAHLCKSCSLCSAGKSAQELPTSSQSEWSQHFIGRAGCQPFRVKSYMTPRPLSSLQLYQGQKHVAGTRISVETLLSSIDMLLSHLKRALPRSQLCTFHKGTLPKTVELFASGSLLHALYPSHNCQISRNTTTIISSVFPVNNDQILLFI